MPPRLPILLMTRPADGSTRFLAELEQAGITGFEPLISPLIDIVLGRDLPDLSGYQGLIFTSATGVLAYQHAGGRTDLPAFAVGDRTADVARKSGLYCDSAAGNADALVRLIENARPSGPLLHIRGEHSRGFVADRLTQADIQTDDAVLYKQPAQPPTRQALEALQGDRPLIAPVFSPRTAQELAKIPAKAPLLVAALSEAVAKPFEKLHIQQLRVAAQPDSQQMQTCVARLLEEARALEGHGR